MQLGEAKSLHPTNCSHLVSYTLFISLEILDKSFYLGSELNTLRPQDQFDSERKYWVWSWLFSQGPDLRQPGQRAAGYYHHDASELHPPRKE